MGKIYMGKEIILATPSQIQRACVKCKLMTYCRESQIGGYTVYVETPNGRRSFYDRNADDAWLSMGQVFANESSGFADAVRYFVKLDASKA